MADTRFPQSKKKDSTNKTRSEDLNILLDNMDSFLFLRPPVGNRETAKAIEELCGEVSRFAHSETAYHGKDASEGKSEKAVPVLSAWDVRRMQDEEVVILHRQLPPFKARRIDWRDSQHLSSEPRYPHRSLRRCQRCLKYPRFRRTPPHCRIGSRPNSQKRKGKHDHPQDFLHTLWYNTSQTMVRRPVCPRCNHKYADFPALSRV